MESEIPGVTSASSPREIGDAVASYLRERLPGGLWQVTAKGLKETQNSQTTEIRLTRDRYSQTGIGAFFHPKLVIRDRSLRAWRIQHPELALMRDDRMFEWDVYALVPKRKTPAVLTTDDPSWRLASQCSIDTLALDLTETILPVREYLRSPTALLSLPQRWLTTPWLPHLIEFAVSKGESDVTMPLVGRTGWLDHPNFKRGQESALAGKNPDGEDRAYVGYTVGLLERHYDLGTYTV